MRRSIALNRSITIVRSNPRSVGSCVSIAPSSVALPPADDLSLPASTTALVPSNESEAVTSSNRMPR